MNLVKDSILINEVAGQNSCEVNVEGDIIVPDVKPDILKILQVEATSNVTNKEIQNGRMNLSGKVNLKILYIPDKADESVKSILTSFDFSHQIENQNLTEDMHNVVECDVSNVNFRLINSRKLHIKTTVALEDTVFCNKSLDVITDIDSDTYTEINKKPLNICNSVAATEEEFSVKDSVEIPSGKMSIREILKIDYRISDKELKPVTGKIVAKGTVNVCILYVGDNNNIEFMEFDIPFTEVFSAPDVNDSTQCEINYNVNDMYYEIAEDSDGDKRIVNLEFLITAQINACENMNIDIVNDFYCPGLETKIERQSYTLNNIVYQTCSQNNLREIIAIDNNSPQIVGVYNVITKAYITKTSLEHNKLYVEGIIDCYILYLSDNTDNPVFSYKKEIPFNYLLDAPNCTDDMDCIVTADIEHSSYSLNMANEVELRCILNICAKITEQKNINLISDYELAELNNDAKMGIVIYFVQKGDTLWKIAKHYHVALDEIIKLNNLDPNAQLMIGQQLIIPVSRKK